MEASDWPLSEVAFPGPETTSPSISQGRRYEIDNISFSQADWYDTSDVLLSENSVWGRMDMDVHADPTDVYYLNVSASLPGLPPVWIIRNMPIFPASMVSSTTRQSVDFDITDLGPAAGMDLTDIGIYYTIAPTSSRPGQYSSAEHPTSGCGGL